MSEPTAADRLRIERALRARLGAAVLPAEVISVSFVARLRGPFAATAFASAVLLGGALLFAFGHQPEATNRAQGAPVPAAAPVSTALTPAPTVEPPTAAARLAIVPSEPALRRALFKEDPLAREVALLSQATGDLHAGRASDALKVLDEHQRRFPNGILNEERRSARAQALCSLGRRSEAETELALLAASIAAAVLFLRFHRPGDARGGMATRHETQQVLGVSRLREAKALIRPDLDRARNTEGTDR
jgi:hypothetical protein